MCRSYQGYILYISYTSHVTECFIFHAVEGIGEFTGVLHVKWFSASVMMYIHIAVCSCIILNAY